MEWIRSIYSNRRRYKFKVDDIEDNIYVFFLESLPFCCLPHDIIWYRIYLSYGIVYTYHMISYIPIIWYCIYLSYGMATLVETPYGARVSWWGTLAAFSVCVCWSLPILCLALDRVNILIWAHLLPRHMDALRFLYKTHICRDLGADSSCQAAWLHKMDVIVDKQ